ncbi:Fe-S cluster assembly protein SufD [Asticcacaulis sp. ZE23SCel15]|uniref:Fe-S cluster assembly protein SufD n=1 Tax=Asticcacaulis sp. ZE23SCel15 TaxID=3059027 RepID=UPI00265E7079|nr:Fe-S cluster assembly protein SufD [Asticcacaulis sp. ZE23SCel15]WKL56423.1 Fe-S cluster assembly protein SufD [Asticcacaulis sp. ZE23SCel15]
MAFDLFDPITWPTRRDEEWKYSDLARHLRITPRELEVSTDIAAPGLTLEGFYVHNVFGADYSGLEAAVMAAKGKLWLRHWARGRLDGVAGFQNKGRIDLKAGEHLILFETYEGKGNYAVHSELEFTLADGARLERVVVMDEPETATSVRQSTIDTAPNAHYVQTVVSTGAAFQRFESHVTHAGHGAQVRMDGAYLLKNKTHFDYTTRLDHQQINGVTTQAIKGLVKDQAQVVFQGRILVQKGADGTDARMRHQALILNDGARVRAKPELEIYADDVQCAHGNTIGNLDENALFFCMSRGMDEATARGLLMQAFIVPVIEAIDDDQLRAAVLEFVEAKAGGFYGV